MDAGAASWQTDRKDSFWESTFRHRGWRDRRIRVAKALHRKQGRSSRLERFMDCGRNAWVDRTTAEPVRYRVRCDRCHDRLCVPCQAERAAVIRSNLKDLIGDNVVRFITLTLADTGTTLEAGISRLMSAFRRLRQRSFWDQFVEGGVGFLEVKWSQDRNRWHPHLHLIVTGKFLPQGLLSEHWKGVTGNSYIVDIRLVRDTRKVGHYVTKYVTKPINATIYDNPDRLSEAIDALHGRKLVIQFGAWKDARLTDVTTADEEWEAVAPLALLMRASASGNADASVILKRLRAGDADAAARPPPERGWTVDLPRKYRVGLATEEATHAGRGDCQP